MFSDRFGQWVRRNELIQFEPNSIKMPNLSHAVYSELDN